MFTERIIYVKAYADRNSTRMVYTLYTCITRHDHTGPSRAALFGIDAQTGTASTKRAVADQICVYNRIKTKRKNMYILRKNTAFLLSATSIGSTIKLSFACNKRASPTTTQKESPQPKEIRNHPTWSLSVTNDKRQYYSENSIRASCSGKQPFPVC